METICPLCGAPLKNGKCEYCNYESAAKPQSEPQQTYQYQQQPIQQIQVQYVQQPAESSKSKSAAAILCFFLGFFGIHRFYVGRVGSGILWLFTAGLFGIGWIVDFIVILCGGFKDSKELPLKNW